MGTVTATGSRVAEPQLRLFIAVPLSTPSRDACRSLLESVNGHREAWAARWVGTDSLHLTLRFLGATPSERVPEIREALTDALAGRQAFAVRLGGGGAFPAAGKVRVLWLGIVEGADALGAMAAAIDERLAARGWTSEQRPFRPHLTVARTDATSIADGHAAARLLAAAAETWSTAFEADRVVLYRSHLGRGPAQYEALEEVGLTG